MILYIPLPKYEKGPIIQKWSWCILKVMPFTYFFVMTRVSLQILAMTFVPHKGISFTISDLELNADKLWCTHLCQQRYF